MHVDAHARTRKHTLTLNLAIVTGLCCCENTGKGVYYWIALLVRVVDARVTKGGRVEAARNGEKTRARTEAREKEVVPRVSQ